MKHKLLILSICISLSAIAQNVGIGTNSPAAKLDINSTHSGVLIPRIALTGSNDVATVPSPTTSTLIYNTATVAGANAVTPGFYYWNGTLSVWAKVLDNISNPMDSDIYNNDGSLSSSRTVTMGSNNLTFSPTSGNFIINPSLGAGRVGIGTATPTGLLHINGCDWSNSGTNMAILQDTLLSTFGGPALRFKGPYSTFDILGAGTNLFGVNFGNFTLYNQNNHLVCLDISPLGNTCVGGQMTMATAERLTVVAQSDTNLLNGAIGVYTPSGGPALSIGGMGIQSKYSNQNLALNANGTGNICMQYSNTTGNVGIGTSAPTAELHVAGNSGILSTGSFTGDYPTATGAGTRMMWLPAWSAFRVGTVDAAQWDSVNLGDNSIGMGVDAIAKGSNSVAIGPMAAATGYYSVAIGSSTASGAGCFAIGGSRNANASFGSSIALGNRTTASGGGSITLGNDITALSYEETVLGTFNTSYTPSFASFWMASDRLFGVGNGSTSGSRSDAMVILKNGNTGIGTSTPLAKLHIVGNTALLAAGTIGSYNVPASGPGPRLMWLPGNSSFRVGDVNGTQWDSANLGDHSIAMGANCLASGSNSIAIGTNASSTSLSSLALGDFASASGLWSVAIGGNWATGEESFAIGLEDSSNGGNSFAIGNSTTSSGYNSLAFGNNLTSRSWEETVLGAYNTSYSPSSITAWVSTDRLLSVGNGTSSGATSDALVILKNGNTGIGTSTPGSLLYVGSGSTAGGAMTGLNVAAGTNSYISTSDGTKTVFMGADFNSYGVIGTLTNHDLVVRTNNSEKMRVTAAGRIGIGTNSPNAPLHIGTSISTGITTASLSRSYFYLGSGTAGFTAATSASGNIMVQADGWYWANGGGYVATSDERIKNIIGETDNEKDMESLMQIKVTDYRYKDEITNGSGLHKKVIAQQLNEIYPQAVRTNTTAQFIPNIYANAASYSTSGNRITVTLNNEICDTRDIKTGGNCKFYLYAKADGTQQEMKGTVVSLDDKKIVIETAEKMESAMYDDHLFVYGTEINDLLSVDYEAISMLNVSATQALAKQLKEVQAELAKLNAEKEQLSFENSQLKVDNTKQSDIMKSMKAQITAIEEKLNITSAR